MSREPAALLEDQLLGAEAALHELRSDPEGVVHDARIALRKLRSTLSLYAAVLHAEPARLLRRELTWLAGELGPARDSQVLLLRIRAAIARLEVQVGGHELLETLARQEADAFAAARAALGSDRFDALLALLDVARLRSLVVPGTSPGELGTGDLQRLVLDLESTRGASDSRLHELRKAVKKARYVRGAHDRIDGGLKRVQTVLGEHQDSVVARAHLARLPESQLREALIAYETRMGERSEKQLRKAVRKLDRALRSGA